MQKLTLIKQWIDYAITSCDANFKLHSEVIEEFNTMFIPPINNINEMNIILNNSKAHIENKTEINDFLLIDINCTIMFGIEIY